MAEHLNYTLQKRQMAVAREQRARDRAHAEALEEQADHIRKQIAEVLSGTGFVIDIDTWGSGGIILEHWASPTASGPDFETPLEGKE